MLIYLCRDYITKKTLVLKKGCRMKKLLQNISSVKIEDRFSTYRGKIQSFIDAHPETFSIGLLAVLCLMFLFFGLGDYPLMDVDETRYAVMARDLSKSFDWNSLMLNMTPFLEKPPLYFWLVATSIKIFGEFSSWAVRIPIALLATFLTFFTYFLGKKVISRKFGLISSIILLTSIFFLILSHVAIIDMVLTVFVTSAIYCGFLVDFCENERYKKYYWWYFYLFMGLGFLAKGLLALAIPVAVIFVYRLIMKNLKEALKPIYLIPGAIIFLILVLPWHLIMYNEYGYQFVKEYFLLHHFSRFTDSANIGRERPFLYFIPVFLLGFMPWTFVFIAFLIDGFKKLAAKYKAVEGKFFAKVSSLFEANTNEQKLILFSAISFTLILLVFSSSSTKLPTYILPIFPFAALLTGYYWWTSDEKGEHSRAIYNTTLIFSSIFLIAAIASSVVFFFLPADIQLKMNDFKEPTIIAFYLFAIFMVLRLKTNRALSVFSGYVFVMFFVIVLAVSQIFNFVYSTGQNEIVEFSKYGVPNTLSTQLVTFDFSVKPSVMVKYQDKVNFITSPDFEALDDLLKYKGGPTFVIVKNKNMRDEEYKKKLESRLKRLQVGTKYSLYVKEINHKYSKSRKKSCEQKFY